MKKTTYVIPLFFLVISCATKKEKLTFSKFIISDAKGQTEIKVDDSGAIFISDNLIGIVDKEGTVITKNGTVLAEVLEDDVIVDGEGNTVVIIDKEGTVDKGFGEIIQWSDDGELMNGNETTGLKIFPADKDSYQTASILLYLHLSF